MSFQLNENKDEQEIVPKKNRNTSNDYYLALHQQEQNEGTTQFWIYSGILHITLAVGALLVEVTTPPPAEPVEITIEEITPEIKKQVIITQKIKAPAPEKVIEKFKEPVALKPVKAQNIPAEKEVPLPTKGVAVTPSMGRGQSRVAPPVPATLDDIETPDIENDLKQFSAKATVAKPDFSNDLDQVAKANQELSKSQAQALAKSLDRSMQKNSIQTENGFRELDEQAEDQARAFAKYKQGLAQASQQRIAAAQAAEAARGAALAEEEARNAMAAEAKARADNQARMAAAFAAAKRAEAAARAAAENARRQLATRGSNNGFGEGDGEGSGIGNSGDPQQKKLAGVPSGIRSLDQLRQMPGNRKPQYDEIERRQGHQGAISLAAYISKEGFPVQFKLLTSTGYRNLDVKSVAAVKKWRFYPGQEGWVEIPFQWDLKGGVQEAGGRLRTLSSR